MASFMRPTFPDSFPSRGLPSPVVGRSAPGISHSSFSALSLPNGPANAVCPGSWHSDPSESPLLQSWLPPSSDSQLKLKNLTHLCSWDPLLPVGQYFSAHYPCHTITRGDLGLQTEFMCTCDPCDNTESPCVSMGLVSTVIPSPNQWAKSWVFPQVGISKATPTRRLTSRSREEQTRAVAATFLFQCGLFSLHFCYISK